MAEKDCVQEEGAGRLSPSSTWCGDCVRVSVDLRYSPIIITYEFI
jgi:hypothetical protein